jgi:hypothetical protein
MPTERESQLAEESSHVFSFYVLNTKDQTIRLLPEGGRLEEAVMIPSVAFRLLVNILTQMAQGGAITLIQVQAEITAQ